MISLISKQALDRIKHDKKISQNIKRYKHEVEIILKEVREIGYVKGRAEKIGKFKVSPKHHHNSFRVAWHQTKDAEGNQLIYIDDFLYHVNERDYNGKWNQKAASGKIKLDNYNNFTELKNITSFST